VLVQAKKKQRRRAPGVGALGKYHHARAGAVVGVFRANNFCISRGLRTHHHFVLLGLFLCAAVQPVYPRAPGHRPVTNLRKALEKWNAVCYLAGGPFGSLYWAQREEICGCRAFLGRLGVCKLTFVRLRSAGIADRKVSWLPCAGSILLRRARGESRGGRRRDVGTAFWCVFDVLAQPRGRRPPSWAGLQSCAMWELSLGVVLGACSAGGCF
jgi:hypothetical protein